jgi:hypothetical protein
MGFKTSLKAFLKSTYEGWKECCKELGKAALWGWRPF